MIEKIGVQYGSKVLGNDELAALFPGWTSEKIFEKTGIRSRFIVGEGEFASDLAAGAAERALDGVDRSTIDFLIFCTQSPDYLLPTMACLLQNRLKLPTRCGAFDFNLGCSGYIYGLAIAHGLMAGGLAQKVLLLTADTYSRFIHPGDKSTRTIFGDAGAATVLSTNSPNRVHSFVLGTDGSGAEQLILRTGGCKESRREVSGAPEMDASGNVRDPNCLFMNGPEIFNFTLQAVPPLIEAILGKAGLKQEQVDYYIFHQANAFMLEFLRRKLKIPPDRFEVYLENCGNTVSSTIPIALQAAVEAGRVKPGMKILLAGFGVGLSWGGCILEWNRNE